MMYVKKDAKIFYFCSRKCEKNMIILGRKPRNITWTAEHRLAKAQAMAASKTKKTTKTKTKTKAANAPGVAAAKSPAKTAAKTAKTTKKAEE